MSIADYKPATLDVSVRGLTEPMKVRGLSLDDIAVLMNEHLVDINYLFDVYSNAPVGAGPLATAQFATTLATNAPALVANTIALAADEPGAASAIRRMPLPVQVDALIKIVQLTFDEAGGARKFFESLTMLLGALAPAPQKTGSLT